VFNHYNVELKDSEEVINDSKVV